MTHAGGVGQMVPRIGLVLMSGGARGAYQAGVVRALAEIQGPGPCPFSVLAGISAGSINVAFLGANAGAFTTAAERLAKLWANLQLSDVFDPRSVGLLARSLRWMTDLSLGGWIGTGRGQALLDTSPLRALLSRTLDLAALERNLRGGLLHGVAVTATHYGTGISVVFFDGHPDIRSWERVTRIGVRERISIDHVMASAAMPILFPAVQVGEGFYGDGAIRNTAPVSPALHLGAERVLAVAIHAREENASREMLGGAPRYPTMAEIGGVLLNSLFLRTLDADVERMRRINQTLSLIPEERRKLHPHRLRSIPVLVLRPSRDLGHLVQDALGHFPYTVRHLLRGLGAGGEAGWELLSYLAFDPSYTRPLLEMGYEDTYARRDEILQFLMAEPRREHLRPRRPLLTR